MTDLNSASAGMNLKAIIPSISLQVREKMSKKILIFWGIYMLIIVPINHFLFPTWYHGELGINFGDNFDIFAVWLIAAYSIGLGVACFIAASDPLRYYATIVEIFIGTLAMAFVVLISTFLLGTNPYLWTTSLTGIILIVFCVLIILVYPLTPMKYLKEDNAH
jgi:hypothetical protein